jgi:subtilisin family serine protease
MKKFLLFAIVFLFCAVFFNPFQQNSQAQNLTEKEIRKQEKFSRLIEKADRKGVARVIVGLKGDFPSEGALNDSERSERRRKIKSEREKFLGRHAGKRLDKIKKFEFIPFLAFEADTAALEQLRTDEQIETIEEDELAAPTLTESAALVGAPGAWSMGFSGSGQTIAVFDTGIDRNHNFLAGKVVSEACYSSVYTDSASVCPNGVTESVEQGSGVNCASTISGCAHGTHVAGIAAGRGSTASGIAKDANIIAIQVFSSVNNAESCGSNPVPCALSYGSDQLKAMERVRVLSSQMSIAAINMSLGGGQYNAACDASQPSRKAMIDNLRSLGIATVVSSGNNGYTSAIGAPACISSTISVGSIDDGSLGTTANVVSSFSNSSAQLSLLAPGKWINSSVPNNGYSIYSGTSMAAPHVAGAFAVLKQKKPTASVTELLNALISTGQPITDSRNSITKPLIKIDAALNALSNPAAPSRARFDFDGDGKTDIGVFRPANGTWYLQNSGNASNNFQQFGLGTDLLAPGDFDGDNKADAGIFRTSTSEWFISKSTGGTIITTFGAAGDVPAAADYDGDGRMDVAIYRPSNGQWWIQRSSNNSVYAFEFGTSADKPVQGDFTGDGKADAAFFRPANGNWYVLRSEDNSFYAVPFGQLGDEAAPGDYDGDGRQDTAVFRPSTGTWYVQRSSAGTMITNFGLTGDKAVPGAFVP